MRIDGYQFKGDCLYFRSDRPCRFHKETGKVCGTCEFYSPSDVRILLIKLGALGDILRTTPLLHSLKENYRNSHITWIVEAPGDELLLHNPLIDEIHLDSYRLFPWLQAVSFDMVINLDFSSHGAALASTARAPEKYGFGLGDRGRLYPFNELSFPYYLTSMVDEEKRKNRKTYQELIHDICGLPYERPGMILNLSPGEREFAARFREEHGLVKDAPLLGLKLGSGRRWLTKRWPREECLRFLERQASLMNMDVLLLRGKDDDPGDAEHILRSSASRILDGGEENSLREFCSLIDICSLLVTPDTLALHAAVCLGKKVVALFGPTSPREIELYGSGTKVISPSPCLECYQSQCVKGESCMSLVDADTVLSEVVAFVEEGRVR